MFKVGDKVYLRDTSEFNDGFDSNPLDVLGIITAYTPEDILDYDVEWENGEVNSYNADDLFLVSDLKVEVKDPLVIIKQSEYDELIDEINMLQELIVELSSVNTSQEQQVKTYQELQKLLRNHHSFQDADGENTTHAQELCDTVRVLQAAYNRVYD